MAMINNEICHVRPGRVIPLARVGYAEKVRAGTLFYSGKLSALLAVGALTSSEGAKTIAVQWGLIQ